MSSDFIDESYFAVLGLIGAGKTSFINAIRDTERNVKLVPKEFNWLPLYLIIIDLMPLILLD